MICMTYYIIGVKCIIVILKIIALKFVKYQIITYQKYKEFVTDKKVEWVR